MNILIATFSFPDPSIGSYDGRFVLSEAKGYAENGASVLVVTPHYPGALREELMLPGVRVHRFRYFLPERLEALKIPGKPIYRPASVLAAAQIPFLLVGFASSIFRHAGWADIVHAQWTVAGLLALPAKWLRHTPLVVTARGSDLRLLPAWLNRFLHRKIDAAIDCFGPQPWNRDYKRSFPARFLTLPLVVETGGEDSAPEVLAAAAEPDNPLIVLYVGRFDRIKITTNRLPIVDLVEAAAILKRRACPLRLFYVGDGEQAVEARLRQAIAQKDVADRVTLLGPKSNVAPYVRVCDLGIGGVAFNGTAQDFAVNGKPQILMRTTDNADTPWQDGVNALFVEPGDPVALADRIQWAQENREELVEIGRRARRQLRKYMTSTRDGGRLYLDAFTTLIEHRR